MSQRFVVAAAALGFGLAALASAQDATVIRYKVIQEPGGTRVSGWNGRGAGGS